MVILNLSLIVYISSSHPCVSSTARTPLHTSALSHHPGSPVPASTSGGSIWFGLSCCCSWSVQLSPPSCRRPRSRAAPVMMSSGCYEEQQSTNPHMTIMSTVQKKRRRNLLLSFRPITAQTFCLNCLTITRQCPISRK